MSRLSALLLGTAIALVPPQIANALSAPEVAKVAEKITVIIDGCSSGSGVIFDKKGKTYYVLTAKHVVDENQSLCEAIAPDGEEHDLEPANIQPIEGLDLAVVQFDSTKRYSVGKLGNSVTATIGQTIYIAGAPPWSQVILERTLRVSPGEIIGIAPKSYEGYTWIYNNATRGGMSGGPILNEAGEIIGIHGKGDKKDGTKENYGIPIEKFKQTQAPFSFFGQVRWGIYRSLVQRARYQKLRDLLSAGEWKNADKETFSVMLQVAGREKEGWLRPEDFENFPCEDLRAIDQLWVKSSNGRFGFSVQKRIWLEVGGKMDWETERAMGHLIGWRAYYCRYGGCGDWVTWDDLWDKYGQVEKVSYYNQIGGDYWYQKLGEPGPLPAYGLLQAPRMGGRRTRATERGITHRAHRAQICKL